MNSRIFAAIITLLLMLLDVMTSKKSQVPDKSNRINGIEDGTCTVVSSAGCIDKCVYLPDGGL